MITTQLTVAQQAQLDALLADSTAGASVYRPPVARDVEILRDLEHVGLSRFTIDCGYEITDAGRAAVVAHAKDLADGQAHVMFSLDDDLRSSIDALKTEAARYLDEHGNGDFRERVLADIEACQDELDRRAEGQSEATGRHRLVPVDERPTQVIPPVQDTGPTMTDREADALAFILSGLADIEQPTVLEQTAPMPSVGTLPGLPVVEQLSDPDEQATIRMIAAIRATPTPAEMAELAAVNTASWAALAADLGDAPRWRRRLRPHRVLLLSVVAAVVVTWGIAWLVLG